MDDHKILVVLSRFIREVQDFFPDSVYSGLVEYYGLSKEEVEYIKGLEEGPE